MNSDIFLTCLIIFNYILSDSGFICLCGEITMSSRYKVNAKWNLCDVAASLKNHLVKCKNPVCRIISLSANQLFF